MKMKRILAAVLCLVMMASLVVVPSMAADIEMFSKTVLTADDTGVTVDWKVKTGEDGVGVAYATYAYDPTVFELVDASGNAVTPGNKGDVSAAQLNDGGGSAKWGMSAWLRAATVDEHTVAIAFARVSPAMEPPFNVYSDYTTIGQFKLKYKPGKTIADVTKSSLREATAAEVKSVSGSTAVVAMDDYKYGPKSGSTNVGFAANVSFGEGFTFSKYLTALTISYGSSATVAVNDTTTKELALATITATDNDNESYDSVAAIKAAGIPISFAITAPETHTGIAVGEDGKVTADHTVTALSTAVTVTATSGSQTATAEVTVTKAAPAATTVVISKGGVAFPAAEATDTVVIPPVDTPNTVTYTAKVLDQYGDEVSETINWAVTGNNLVTVTDGVVSIAKGSTKTDATLTATSSSDSTKKATVTLKVVDMEVDWSKVTVKEAGITYGDPVKNAFTLGAATATAGSTSITGKWEIVGGENTIGAGESVAVTVKFVGTAPAAYVDAAVEKTFNIKVAKKPITVAVKDQERAYASAVTVPTASETTLTVPTLVGTDDIASLSIVLANNGLETTTWNDDTAKVAITGTSTAANYDVTVTPGKWVVTPLTITKIEGMPGEVTVGKGKLTANDATLATAKLPSTVTYTYDSTDLATETTAPTFDKTLADIQKTNAGSSINVTLTVPKYAVLGSAVKAPVAKINVTAKTPVNVAVTAPAGITYGAELADPTMVISADEGADPSEVPSGDPKWTFSWKGAGDTKYGPSATKPVNAGTYTVVATLDDTVYAGAGESAEFTIAPADLTSYNVALTIPDGGYTYNNTEFKPAVVVKATAEAEKALAANTDYTVEYDANKNAGTATVSIKGKGNYTGTATANFTIAKAEITELKPTITGTAKSGSALSATVNVVDPANQVKWEWYVGEVKQAAETASLEITDAMSNKAITVKAVAATGAGANYTGTSAASAAKTVDKVALGGTVTVTGASEPMATGDTLTVALTGILPEAAQTGAVIKVNGTALEEGTTTYQVAEGDTKVTIEVSHPDFSGSVKTELEKGKTALATDGWSVAEGTGEDAGKLVLTAPAGLAETEYTVEWQIDGKKVGEGSSYANTAKGVTVVAVITGAGDHTGSASASFTVDAVKPDAPAKPTVSAASGKLTVSWKAPADNGAAITGYKVSLVLTKDAEGAEQTGQTPVEVTVSAATTSYTFEDLTNNATYEATVIATNSVGDSEASEAAEGSPKAASGGGGGGSSAPAPATPDPDAPTEVETTIPATTDEDGAATATMSGSDATKLVAEANKAAEGASVVVTPDVADDATKVTVNMPVSAVNGVAKSPAEDITVKTPVADVVLGDEALKDLANTANRTVGVTAEKNEDGSVTVTVEADGKTVDEVPGLKAKLPVSEDTDDNTTVAVLVKEDGTEEIIRDSVVVDGQLVTPLEGSGTVKIVDNAKGFEDTPGHWAEKNIDFAAAHDLFQGTSATKFSPNMAMNRAMVATVLFRLNGEKIVDAEAAFEDLETDTWYNDAVDWANANKIIEGYAGNFNPNGNVSRQDLAVMIYRYAKAAGKNVATDKAFTLVYEDVEDIGSWAVEALTWATKVGLFTGKPGNLIDPTGDATRAEVAIVMERFVKFCAQ